jgi:EAL domain-containing protein (putative c-di-GMP-specific phosphodiesterase class I)
MASPKEGQRNLPSQENLLLDYIHRLEKHKKDRKVVHLLLSNLRPFNRRDQHIRTAAGNFDALVSELSGQLFILKNSDIFFVFKESVLPEVETLVQKVRFLFSDDPLVADEKANTPTFAAWYDADSDFSKILGLAQNLAQKEQKRQSVVRARMDARSALKAKQEQGEPMTPKVLEKLETALTRADLSNLVRRQFICAVDSKLVPTQDFSELFISIKDLRETILPGVNVTANRWLFQHLTETLDKRMLSMLTKTDSISISGEISFNINVATVLSKEFQIFDDNVSASRRGSMIIELQKEDVFVNLNSYLFAREYLQEKGYRVCLDGLSLDAIQMINLERLGVDMCKLVWHPDLVDGGDQIHATLSKIVKDLGKRIVIMCRCDNREAVDFGRSVGITHFQGRYVETLIAEDGRRRELLRLKRRIERN